MDLSIAKGRLASVTLEPKAIESMDPIESYGLSRMTNPRTTNLLKFGLEK